MYYSIDLTKVVLFFQSIKMESTIKQAEEERTKAYENAKRLYEECRPVKEELDMLRMRAGLDIQHDLAEDAERFKPE